MTSQYCIAVLADIHGNWPAFQAVLDDLKNHPPLDAILVAGDITGGPHQQAILERLGELQAVMIQGNNERSIARLAGGSAPEHFYHARQFLLTRWTREHLSAEQVALVCARPEQRVFTLPGADSIRMVHGSPRDVNEQVFSDQEVAGQFHAHPPVTIDDVIGLVDEPVIIFGHTHLQWQARRDGRLALNPGGVSFAQDGYLGAEYALLHWDGRRWTSELYRAPYDLEQIRRDYAESGLLSAGPLPRVILQSILTGKDYLPVFFSHVQRIAEAAGLAGLSYYPDNIWDEAERTFSLV